ncbi:2H-1,4-benzoxazin-2-yl glucoside beta-D-glucosidase [Seminavis robusta]|uniref:beta-glucosidase n=1 Tax=Seminavis robusta TaxID=568900 RepID=A0A9N8H6Q3_9STRA|nr:2H-1,4-benzoxazin-2-yl glucoside beta-D-glucosidase [Seminavis robusta]|eukprot:Sro49_g028770.1 2H-1,4-benzoxazin-2-yl glucoside beta-D-glucosidase (499) ;mRNA; r:115623-117119
MSWRGDNTTTKGASSVSTTPVFDQDTSNDIVAFPKGFLFGSATSSYQVEGAAHEDGRGMTVWDTFCYQGGHVLNNDTGDVACDHYHLFERDVQLMKQLGLQGYRFSIAWTRILPSGYYNKEQGVNQAGIDFYNRLIDTLIEHNIDPWITLFHWDLPQQLEDDVGGWLDPSGIVVDAFANYSRICFEAFGDRVQHWITLNEPWTVAVHGYNDGIKAPGRNSNGATETYIVAHNQLLAHAKAATIFKQEFSKTQGGFIGISNSADYRYPLDPNSPDDIQAAERAMLFQFGWFMDPVIFGDYPDVMRQRLGSRLPVFTPEQQEQLQGSCDFLGINTYSSALTTKPKKEPEWGGYWADMFVTTQNDPSWKKNSMGWAIVPDATRELLLWIRERYGNPLLYITENGTAEDDHDVETAQHDEIRRSFFEGHLRACAEAIDAGVRLAGYFAWSLMDNFEWEYGYQRRFGICYVDFETQVRTPKSSALWYSETIATNGGNIARKRQ